MFVLASGYVCVRVRARAYVCVCVYGLCVHVCVCECKGQISPLGIVSQVLSILFLRLSLAETWILLSRACLLSEFQRSVCHCHSSTGVISMCHCA